MGNGPMSSQGTRALSMRPSNSTCFFQRDSDVAETTMAVTCDCQMLQAT